MAKVSNDISELKRLLGADAPQSSESEHQQKSVSRIGKSTMTKSESNSDEAILHSYIRSVLDSSEVYDVMKDTAIDGVSFRALADACQDDLSKDIVEYFACCFYEGEYSLLDTFAEQCEQGNRTEPSANASVLGHMIPMTFQQEFNLLAELFSIALMLDRRMDDNQEKVQFVYVPDCNGSNGDPQRDAGKNNNRPVRACSSRNHDTTESIAKAKNSRSNKPKHRLNQIVIKLKNTIPSESATVIPNARKHQSIVSFPSMKRRSFSNHVASSGVWGRIADYGGFNGRLIYINAGHGR